MDQLFADLQSAPDQNVARALNAKLWELWLMAPDPYSQGLLDAGMERRDMFDYETAEASLTSLIQYCPFYAEGWNQRAFVRYLRQNWEGALTDLNEALELNPRHVGALSGKALTLINMGRGAEAQVPLRAAVDLNPWLSERALLTDQDL